MRGVIMNFLSSQISCAAPLVINEPEVQQALETLSKAYETNLSNPSPELFCQYVNAMNVGTKTVLSTTHSILQAHGKVSMPIIHYYTYMV